MRHVERFDSNIRHPAADLSDGPGTGATVSSVDQPIPAASYGRPPAEVRNLHVRGRHPYAPEFGRLAARDAPATSAYPDSESSSPVGAVDGSVPLEPIGPGRAVYLLARHLRPMRLPFTVGLVLMTASTVVSLGMPLAAQYVLDSLAAAKPLGRAVLVLVAVVAVSTFAQTIGGYLLMRSAEDVVRESRRRLVDQLLSVSLTSMRRHAPGDLMSRVSADMGLIRQVATASLLPFVTGLVSIVGSAIVMITMDPVLFGVTVVAIMVPLLLQFAVMPRLQRSAEATQRSVGAMGSELERVLGAYTTMKASGSEHAESAGMGIRTAEARDSGVHTAFLSIISMTVAGLSVQAAFLVVLGFGAFRVQSEALGTTTLVAFLLYSVQLAAPVTSLVRAVGAFQTARAALGRIAEVEAMEREAESATVGPDPAEPGYRPVNPNAPGAVASLDAVSWRIAVELDDVTFRYSGAAQPTLIDVSLTVPQTGVTAIVGPSGSGKSSLLKLIDGFFPVERGMVRVAGRNLPEWDLHRLRRAVAIVEQETPVLAGTLRENLTYGIGPVDDESLLSALHYVGLGGRFAGAEDLDHEMGYRGGVLSGGERQRISIARALLRYPSVLLLDEASSQLDAVNEAHLRGVVSYLGTRIAVVLVAHRLSTVVNADQIVVLEAGRIVDVGTHDVLVRRNLLYRSMVIEQGLIDDVGGRHASALPAHRLRKR